MRYAKGCASALTISVLTIDIVKIEHAVCLALFKGAIMPVPH